MTQITTYNPSYKQIHKACRRLAYGINYAFPGEKQLCAIARGGLLPGLILSHQLKTPLIIINYSSKDGRGDDKGHSNVLPDLNPNIPLILVDDICDSGLTLREIYDHYWTQQYKIYTCVLIYKEKLQSIFRPNDAWKTIPDNDTWVNFPFEVQ